MFSMSKEIQRNWKGVFLNKTYKTSAAQKKRQKRSITTKHNNRDLKNSMNTQKPGCKEPE